CGLLLHPFALIEYPGLHTGNMAVINRRFWLSFLVQLPRPSPNAQPSRFARNCSSSRNAWSRAEVLPRHSAPMTTDGQPASGKSRTFGDVFAFGTITDRPMPKPLAT